MVKKLQTKTYGQYAILLTAAMVLFSWAGCQILVLSGCFFNLRDSDEAQFFFAVGAALLLYSLYIKTRLKRHEISPWRESARAFYLAAIGALPLLTYAYYQFFLRRWMAADKVLATFEYSTFVISALYMFMFGVWVNGEVPHYPVAPRNVWWRQPGRWLGRIFNSYRTETGAFPNPKGSNPAHPSPSPAKATSSK